LILHAIEKGCNKFIIGLGGSATNDAGCGMAEATGIRFLDKNNVPIGPGGGALGNLQFIDFSKANPYLKNCSFTAACDVNNPLCGEKGASVVYGPQKGASKEDVEILDSNLAHFAEIVKEQTGIDILTLPGAGAAGGMGAGVKIFLNAKLEKGFDIVSKITDLQNVIKGADLIITGEGKIDNQTLCGKTPSGVAKIAQIQRIPVIALAGTLGDNFQLLYNEGFNGIFPIANTPVSLEYSMKNAALLIEEASERILKVIHSSMFKK
jgi:glycerate kinase